MKDKLKQITEEALAKIKESKSLDEINDIRVEFLGKKGRITSIMKELKDIAPEDRPAFGQLVNEAKQKAEQAIEDTKSRLQSAALEAKLASEKIDVTLPAKKKKTGHGHPNQVALDEVERIFVGMGYDVVEGPEVEYQEYNFTKLNIPEGHPARDEQDTFYITDEILLRSQTSPVQAHVMEQGKLPIRMIAPGRVFRSDSIDATHSPSFHQIEGLVVDKHITMTDLKGTLTQFAEQLFGEGTKTRFRPHHFQFTEPSAEVDVSCFKCGGKGCRFCKGEGWVEILGCGMVDPNVLEACGIDSKVYTGYAFGLGIERITNLKYRVADLRMFSENDTRFLDEFVAAE